MQKHKIQFSLYFPGVSSTVLHNSFSVYQNVIAWQTKRRRCRCYVIALGTLLLFAILWNMAVQSATGIKEKPVQSIYSFFHIFRIKLKVNTFNCKTQYSHWTIVVEQSMRTIPAIKYNKTCQRSQVGAYYCRITT